MSDADLDRNVFCAPCGVEHAHMQDCPNKRPVTCGTCGAVRYTAAAIFEHGKTHVDTVQLREGVVDARDF